MEKWSEEKIVKAKSEIEAGYETIRAIDVELANYKERIAELEEKREQHSRAKRKKESNLFSQGWWYTEDGWTDLNKKWR